MPTLRMEHHAGGTITYITREPVEVAPLLRSLTAAGAEGELVLRDVERDEIVIRLSLERCPEEGDRAQPAAGGWADFIPLATGGRG